MHETAFAKLNLALHIRERLPDGYHRIETLFAFCEDGDGLSVTTSDRIELDITGPFAADLTADPDNLVLRAANALHERFGASQGARLVLDKRLPIAAGIGGGSADAAAALRLLVRWWAVEVNEKDLLGLAAELGADVPACLLSRAARGEGRGDRLTLVDADELSGAPVLLVNPKVALSTVAVFRAWDGIDKGGLDGWREGRNDLEPAAMNLVPEIRNVVDALSGAQFARMSGSGATCFGLFPTDAARDAAAASIAEIGPHWWMMTTRLR